ncbi:MAG: putative nucleotidyltransferase with HDIG domain [Kiritimatiellia bacterium]|jgi:putative nucleotidyltransferase with HDIG domain
MRSQRLDVDAIIKKAKQLPSPPLVLSRVMALMADDNRSRSDVVRVIEVDAAFTAQVLRTVNSAAYRRARKINSIPEAISMLGESELVKIVVRRAAAVIDKPDLTGYGLEDHGLWRNSLRIALAADAVAWSTGTVSSSVAYTAGLLADVGKLALGTFLADRVDEVMDWQLANPGSQFVEAERAVLGLDHAELGALMVEDWGLPEDVINAIRYHHRPVDSGEHSVLAYTIHVADAVASMVGGVQGIDGLWYSLDPYWTEVIDLGLGQFEGLVDDVRSLSDGVEQQLKRTG